jgi:dienelactone hydrolase
MNSPQLLDTVVPPDPAAVVLVLHGGASRGGSPMVSPTQLSVLRMVPIARRIARAGAGRLAVLRLLNSTRGWDTGHTPVDDADWALDQCRERFGSLPIGLVGHSLGGRAALLAGDRPPVRSVVALNPWLYATDHADLGGRAVLIAHGTRDRIARPERSAQVARHLGAAEVTYVRVRGGKHAMLARHAMFDTLAADFTASTLLDSDPDGSVAWTRSSENDIEV